MGWVETETHSRIDRWIGRMRKKTQKEERQKMRENLFQRERESG